MASDLVLEERRGAIVTLTLNRPEALNAFTPDLLSALEASLMRLETDRSVNVLIVTGAGRAFSAGIDLKHLSGGRVADGDVGGRFNDTARALAGRLSRLPQASIAKINGACFTGALEIALACDLRLAAEDAKFGDTHAKLGLRPTWGMSQRLPRAVGMMRAKELSFTARTFTGREAQDYGLVLEAVPRERLDARVEEIATAIAANSPGTVAAYKDLYAQADESGLEAGLAYEATRHYAIPDSADRVKALLAQIARR
ncbi:MAG: enoyl-CoA hydratase/isomerase family protein [Alphaproteobacteria bacterium]|nr:enoyl-CoA hydratase/isomerase family protein [Alphaproteobacteria bacterium]